MCKTIPEDWTFDIEVLSAAPCHIGLEVGDAFFCTYGCPAGFCPKTMGALYTLCEAARAGGDCRLLGGRSEHEIDFVCADGAVTFRLHAAQKGGPADLERTE